MTELDARIAVVDDERFFRDAICEILKRAGFACVTADDAPGALALGAEEAVGVMVLDVRLAGGRGLDVLRKLRASRPALRVIVLSGSSDQEPVLEALRIGACDYLAKPLHDEELVLAVGRAAEAHALAAKNERLSGQIARLAALTTELSRAASGSQPAARGAHVAETAVHGAAALLGAGRTSLLLLSDAGDELRVVAAVAPSVAVEHMDPVAVGQGVAGVAFERGEPVLQQSGAPRHALAIDPAPGRYRSDSFAVAPVVRGERCLGVLCATEAARAGGLGVDDLALLQVFAARLGELLDVDRDAKDAPTRATPTDADTAPEPDAAVNVDAELVRQICEALVNDVEPERVLRAVLAPIERELRAAPVSLHLLDGATGALACEVQLDGGLRADRASLPAARGLTGTVLQSGHLVATRTPDADPRYDALVDTPEDGVPGPFLCLPLRLRGKVVGLCRVFLPEGAVASASTGEALAAVLSAAVRNVLLYRSLVESIEEVAEARRQARR